jgi:hypothetical protein
MKKLVLFAAVIVAVSFASCKKQAPATEVTEDTTTVVEQVPADTAVAVDSTVAAQ